MQTLSELKEANKATENDGLDDQEVDTGNIDESNQDSSIVDNDETMVVDNEDNNDDHPEDDDENQDEQDGGVSQESGDDTGSAGDENDTDDEVEAWMLDDGDDERTIPLTDHIQLRQKLKEDKRDLQREVDELKAQLANQQSNQQQPVQSPSTRPKLADFEFDEDAYNEALDQWYLNQFDSRVNQNASNQQAENLKKQIKQGSDAHYQRALQMVNKYKLDPNKYQAADRTIRQALDDATGGNGDIVADAMAHYMGEGSEKVFFTVGTRPEKLNQLLSALREDPSGMKAALFLGKQLSEVSRKVSNPKKKQKAPPKKVKGGGTATPTTSNKLKEKYGKTDNPQERWEIRKQAKAKGIDVGDW